MESLLELLAALVIWRFLLAVGISIVSALGLSQAFAGFTAGHCIVLVLLGIVLGAVWHSRAETDIGLLDKRKKSRR